MNLGFLQGLAGAMGGLSQGLDDYREQKRLAALEFRNKQQLEMQQQAQEFNQIKAAMDSLQAGDTVDPDLAARASRYGLNNGIEKDPVTGSLKMKSRLEDEVNQTRLADLKTQQKLHEQELGIATQKASGLKLWEQAVGDGSLMSWDLPKRQALGGLLGIKDIPMTPEEQLAEARRNPQVLAAGIYRTGQNQGSPGVDINAIYDAATKYLQATLGEEQKMMGIPQEMVEAEVARRLGLSSGANKTGKPVMQPGQRPQTRKWSKVEIIGQ